MEKKKKERTVVLTASSYGYMHMVTYSLKHGILPVIFERINHSQQFM